jgi:hypothetical protein
VVLVVVGVNRMALVVLEIHLQHHQAKVLLAVMEIQI